MERTRALGLTALEQRLMGTIARRGLRTFVLIVTGASVALSELLTVSWMLVLRMTAVEMLIGALTALLVPSIVAPLTAWMLGRLLQALGRASAELHHLAHTDALTGVANRRSFAEDAAALWTRRSESIAVVAMVDIDDFKAVNDRFGHATGDLALVSLASALVAAASAHTTGSVVGRLGGDEFAVVALAADEAAASSAGVAILAACDLDRACPGVTATAGAVMIAAGVEADLGLDEALVRADHALYASKQPSGRTVHAAS
ncbi:MAG: GGDEF domain-containing protein [Ilumatobacteraceae bacterium]|nr:GGDEF domain-containing protein [Acidimicrobiales bacterium]MCB9392845.1 GGDEF domain-containing protein [Acidimicrobiaceae bacterium]